MADREATAFWPRIGDVCKINGQSENEKFVVVDIVNNYPCKSYNVRPRNTGVMLHTYRYQMYREQPREQTTRAKQTDTEACFDSELSEELVEALLKDYSSDNEEKSEGDLDEDELDNIETNLKAKGTLRNESWALKKFKVWQERRKKVIKLEDVTPTELAEILRKFYAEVRTNDGNLLSPPSLRGTRAGLHRTITSSPINCTTNIITDKEFLLANKMLDNMCKMYSCTSNKKQKHCPAIEEGDLHKLGEYFSSYRESPEKLIHTFWFLLSFHFARKGREGLRDLTKSSFEVKRDDKGQDYLVAVETEKTKNWQGGSSSKAWDYSDVRAYGLSMSPVSNDLNIVEVYKFYISKLNPKREALFQRPKSCVPSSGPWFDNAVLGINTLGDLMKIISKRASLSSIYTNHSVRATTITILFQKGVDAKQICKLTKHKNEESLKHYIDGQTSEQKRQCGILLAQSLKESNTEQANELSVVSLNSKQSNEPSVVPLNSKQQKAETLALEPIDNSDLAAGESSQTNTPATANITNQFTKQNITFPSAGPQQLTFNVSGGACNFHFHYQSQSEK